MVVLFKIFLIINHRCYVNVHYEFTIKKLEIHSNGGVFILTPT